ncbi:MAG: peptidoglycan editing factor PgeF [Clostridia bacterium]|nr:peptidoglycan editing factor PgeF [Clostridia bacterium]
MTSAFIKINQNGATYYSIPLFEATRLVAHGFSTRLGGVSQGTYTSLNLGTHVGDQSEAVVENRRRLCGAIGMDTGQIIAAKQVHGDHVHVATVQDCGRGALAYRDALEETDALITNQPGVPLSTYYADCVPLYFLDPVKKAIGLAHAGWKGTVLQIGRKTLAKMNQVYGSQPEDCLAAIAPSIGPCCYEVGDEVAQEFKKTFSFWSNVLNPKQQGKWQLDLWEANRLQLLEAGVKADNIAVACLCTGCHNDIFFSYRADGGITGRLGAFLMLKNRGDKHG